MEEWRRGLESFDGVFAIAMASLVSERPRRALKRTFVQGAPKGAGGQGMQVQDSGVVTGMTVAASADGRARSRIDLGPGAQMRGWPGRERPGPSPWQTRSLRTALM